MKTLGALFAVASLLVALAMFAPASLLDARLQAATQGHLRLADTAGTVWNGRGLVTSEAHTWSLPVSWRIDPLSVVRGDIGIALQPAEGGDLPRGNVSWRDPTLTLDGVAFTLPAAALNGAIASGNAMVLGGYLAFDAPHLTLGSNGGDGAASARWSGARLAGNAGMLALGTVTMNFAPRDGGIQGRVENRGGDARIEGEFALGSAGIDFNATLTPLPSTPPAVMRALGALGTPEAGGAVRMQWRSGKL